MYIIGLYIKYLQNENMHAQNTMPSFTDLIWIKIYLNNVQSSIKSTLKLTFIFFLLFKISIYIITFFLKFEVGKSLEKARQKKFLN